MTSPTRPLPARTRVAIIGAGFAGIAAAHRLKEAGVDELVLLERDADVGGTWRANTYPGAACDIPSHLYSFSFAPNPHWTRSYSTQPEIEAYLRDCVDRLGLRAHLHTGVHVVRAEWDDPAARWTLTCEDGRRLVADVLVPALGPLREPRYPDLPGRETFAGPQMHTARWDHDVDLAGRRVAVIGTGASAIQVVPELAGHAAHVVVLQRTPPWVTPRLDRAYPAWERRLLATVPGLQKAYRWGHYWAKELRFAGFGADSRAMRQAQRLALRVMQRHIRDPELRRALTPDYQMGCKRILVSSDFYPALARDDVSLETTAISEVVPEGLRLADGRVVEVDAIVYGTGFRVDDPLGRLDIVGRDGVDLRTVWGRRPAAYLGATVPGFPNLFVMIGPNTGLGHNSMVFMMEAELHHVVAAVRRLQRPGIAAVEVRREALDRFVAEVNRRHRGKVWASGCASWYLGDSEENWTLWPGWTVEYWWRTRRFDERDYHLIRRADLPRPADLPSPVDLPRPAASPRNLRWMSNACVRHPPQAPGGMDVDEGHSDRAAAGALPREAAGGLLGSRPGA